MNAREKLLAIRQRVQQAKTREGSPSEVIEDLDTALEVLLALERRVAQLEARAAIPPWGKP